ncbi:c-type cytochrome [Hymenobacter sp. 102]|uniref:c-type cytochrome n=1 Tax=Hymenobacter sp. 102 TaxID=3403152 RepID=UPI003CFB0084
MQIVLGHLLPYHLITQRFIVRFSLSFQLLLAALSTAILFTAAPARAQTKEVTYARDIAPIISRNCVSCHKVGGAGPFSLMTYAEVFRHRKTIQAVTKNRYMPPWKADPHYVSFANERRLTTAEIQLISRWVESNGREGSKSTPISPSPTASNLPPKPDLVLRPKQALQIKGDGNETFVIFKIPFELPQGKAVKALEFIPGNRQLVHHANFAVQAVSQDVDIYRGSEVALSDQFQTNLGEFQPFMQDVVYYGGWIPGASPQSFPNGIGFTMPTRGVILLTMHYGPSSVPTQDLSTLNIYFSPTPIKRIVQATSIGSGGIGKIEPPLVIPADSVKTFRVDLVTSMDLSVLYVWPHMHLLGKNFEAWATTPDNKVLPMVKIPEWDFRWQEAYQFKNLLHVPKGSIIHVRGTYDNTAQNPNNPFNPPQMIISQDLMESRSEMLNLIMLFLEYQPGDERIH